MRFIEGDPVFHSISKSFEAGEGIMLEVLSVTKSIHSYTFCKSEEYFLEKNVIYISVILTLFVCSTILHIYLQESAEDPNGTELHKAGFLIERTAAASSNAMSNEKEKKTQDDAWQSNLFPVKHL